MTTPTDIRYSTVHCLATAISFHLINAARARRHYSYTVYSTLSYSYVLVHGMCFVHCYSDFSSRPVPCCVMCTVNFTVHFGVNRNVCFIALPT